MTNYVVIDQSKSLNMFGPITNDSNTDLLSSSSRMEEDDNFPCGYCQKTFQTFPHMVNHIQNNHYKLDSDTNFSPLETNKDSTDSHAPIDLSSNQLNRNAVTKEWTYACHPCHQEFANEDELVIHLESNHIQSISSEISDSEASSNQQNETTKSQRTSFYFCKICEKSFRNKSSLSEHRWIHSETNPPWRCDKCDKIFPFLSRLKKHLLTHIEKHDRKITYKCSKCDRTFFRKNDLWSHEKAKGHRELSYDTDSDCKTSMLSVHHAGYKCKDCGRLLASSGALYNHRQSLHNHGDRTKLFTCPDCGKRFPLKQKMVSHFKRSHSKNY